MLHTYIQVGAALWRLLLYLIASFNTLPALKTGIFPAGITMGSLVLGFRPVRSARSFTSKLPKPVSWDLISRAQRFLNLGEKCVQDFLRIRFGDSALLGHTSNQFSLVHKANSFLFLLIWISTLYMITASAAYHSGECSSKAAEGGTPPSRSRGQHMSRTHSRTSSKVSSKRPPAATAFPDILHDHIAAKVVRADGRTGLPASCSQPPSVHGGAIAPESLLYALKYLPI